MITEKPQRTGALTYMVVFAWISAAIAGDDPPSATVAEDDPARVARMQKEAEDSSGTELCDWYANRYAGDDLAEKELRKRRLLTDREWTVIKGRVPRVGERELVAICIWGMPEDKNTTVTAVGTRVQWVYSASRYIYFENGKLTAFSF